MTSLDVSCLLLDQDFVSRVTLITRSSSVNEHGEGELVETVTPNVLMSVQGASRESLARLPEGARLSDFITVYYRGELHAESPGGYADVVVWKGKRYQVKDLGANFMHLGVGWTKADCELEAVNA